MTDVPEDRLIVWNSRDGDAGGHAGVGDRLRGIATAVVLAHQMKARVLVRWIPNKPCPATFDSLFEMDPVFSFQQMSAHAIARLQPLLILDHHLNIMPQIADGLFRRNREVAYFDRYEDFYGEWKRSIPAAFRPLQPIQEVIDRFANECFCQQMVAIHLRRTDVLTVDDYIKPIDERSVSAYDELLLSEIDRVRAAFPAAQFFLASDDRKYFAEWDAKLRERGVPLVTFPKNWNAGLRQTTMADAVIDMYLIAKCSLVLGTVWSSFLWIAENLGQVKIKYLEPSHCIRSPLIDPLEYSVVRSPRTDSADTYALDHSFDICDLLDEYAAEIDTVHFLQAGSTGDVTCHPFYGHIIEGGWAGTVLCTEVEQAELVRRCFAGSSRIQTLTISGSLDRVVESVRNIGKVDVIYLSPTFSNVDTVARLLETAQPDIILVERFSVPSAYQVPAGYRLFAHAECSSLVRHTALARCGHVFLGC